MKDTRLAFDPVAILFSIYCVITIVCILVVAYANVPKAHVAQPCVEVVRYCTPEGCWHEMPVTLGVVERKIGER